MQFKSNVYQFQLEMEKACERTLDVMLNVLVEGSKKRAPVDTGQLRNSIYSSKISPKEGVAGSDLDYAIKQELGTEGNIPRRFMTRTIKEDLNENKIKEIIKNEFNV